MGRLNSCNLKYTLIRIILKHYFFVYSGRCQPFRGTICSKYISDIFVPNFKPQKQSDENISIAAEILRDFMRPSCKRSFVKVLCYSLFPPCQPGKCPRPQLLCKDQCEVLRARTCSKESRLLKTRLGAVADEIIPNCSKLASFHPDCIRVPVGEFPQRNREWGTGGSQSPAPLSPSTREL